MITVPTSESCYASLVLSMFKNIFQKKRGGNELSKIIHLVAVADKSSLPLI